MFCVSITFFNSLTGKKEEFTPLVKSRVGIYSCGPTVYNYPHIGNMRAFLFTDLLKRFLSMRGYGVYQVMNITDVDDKTIRDSRKAKKSLLEFTSFYEKEFFSDSELLGIEPASKYPRATEHVKEMISFVQDLLDKAFAYKAKDGIYFSIKKFKPYGKLSKVDLSSLKKGASGRCSSDEYDKAEASDFVLWKYWTLEDGSVFWEAPFGKGRPGWHLECSVMSMKYLGESFDVHTGGVDLRFPHHENEIAQSESLTGKKLAKYWLHVEHLLVNGKKMSKRDGNFFVLRDLIEQGYSPKAIRFLLVSTHYRSQLNFTLDSLIAAGNTVKGLQDFFEKLSRAKPSTAGDSLLTELKGFRKAFNERLDDDLDVANALVAFFDFMRLFNSVLNEKGLSAQEIREALAFAHSFNKLFGVIDEDALVVPREVMLLVKEREEAKSSKQYSLADSLREKVKTKGFWIEDTKQGPVVKKS
ncbi:MAG: cysteine--tRNA ligase [Candidatus Micrarchaeota archaeon]